MHGKNNCFRTLSSGRVHKMIHPPSHLFKYSRQASTLTTLAAFFSSTTMIPAPPQINPLPRSLYPHTITYAASDLARQDESKDSLWYSQPRFVQHIDDGAISTLKSYYSEHIKEGDSVLDLCSSWTSHLAPDLKPRTMTGYGMNGAEMAANNHLTKYFVKDLNENPSFEEIGDAEIDVVICNVSVDYLTKPVEVFKEIRRVLKDGGTAHMAFSDRCFPTKVIGRWLRLGDEERRQWIGGYFWASGGFEGVQEVVLKTGTSGILGEDPLFVVRGVKSKD